MQWVHSQYMRGDMHWQQDSYKCNLDAAQMSAGMNRTDILSGAYADAVADVTWKQCMKLKGWSEVQVQSQQASSTQLPQPESLENTVRPTPCVGSYEASTWTNCVGTLSVSSSGQTYVGEFKGGKANGQGTLTFADGAKYVGELKDNNFNGQGTLTAPNGNKYVGEFRNGKFHGQGTAYDVHGAILKSGIWENSVFVRSE